MTTLIKNSKYFTAHFVGLSDVRKIEELMTELSRIVYTNEVDTDEFEQAMTTLDALRKVVAE
jgi:hypothetical protein